MAPHSARRRPERRAVLAAVILAAIGPMAISSVHAATVTVASVNFRFDPESRTVNEGDVVRWTFAGDPHTVTSGAPGAPDGRFDSGVKDAGGSFQVTFDSAGSFPYFCQIHPEQMFGTIIVRAGPAPTPRPTPKPTPRPTPRPTATPTAAPTQAPTAPPTAAPTATPEAPPPASPSSSTPSPTPSAATPSAPATASAVASGTPGAGPSPDAGDAAAGLDPVPIIALGLVVGVLVAGGVALLRRSPRG